MSSGGEDPNKTMLGVSPFAPDNDPNGRASVRPEPHTVPGQQSVEARLAEKRRDLQLKTRPMQAIADLDWDLPEGTTSGASPVVPSAPAPSPAAHATPSFDLGETDAFARLPGAPAPSGAVPPIDAAARTLVMTNEAMHAALQQPTPTPIASPAVAPPARSGTLMMSASDMAKFAAEQHAQVPSAFAEAAPTMPAPFASAAPAPFAAATPAQHAPAPVDTFAPPPVAAPAPFVTSSGPLPTTAAEAGRPYAGGTMVMSAFDNPGAHGAPAAAASLGAAAHAQTGSSVSEGRLEMPHMGAAPHVARGVHHPSHGQGGGFTAADVGSLAAGGGYSAQGAPPAVPFTPSSAPLATPVQSGPPKALLLVGAVVGAVIVIAILMMIF